MGRADDADVGCDGFRVEPEGDELFKRSSKNGSSLIIIMVVVVWTFDEECCFGCANDSIIP